MRRSFLVTFCILSCIAATAGAATVDRVATGVTSAQMVMAPERTDFQTEADQRRALYEELVGRAADHAMVDLGELRSSEMDRLNGNNRAENRRFLVGIDRTVGEEVDLALGVEGRRIGGTRTALTSLIWTTTLRSPGATAVRAHLSELALPDGAALYVYGVQGQAFGPYTGTGPVDTGELWTNTVLGDSITLHLEIAAPLTFERLFDAYFVIESVGHMGERFELARWQADSELKEHCTSGIVNAECVVNAECPGVPSAIEAAKPAIASMLYASKRSYYICSGGLVADSSGTETPYFITANHCIGDSKEAGSLETYWDFSTPCGTSSCQYAWDIVGRATPGSTLLSTSSTSDYSLLQLQSVPSGRTYLGWTSAAVAFSNATDLYRLSHPAGAPLAYSEHSVNTSAGTCSSWPRGSWIYSRDTVGATEGGSSGSPVLNAAGEIVGQLSGACGTNLNDNCDAVNNATVDGAFAAYFGSVAQWLDTDPGSCIPSDEICDGIDNDCDGAIDEDGVCDVPACGERKDPCTTGDDCCSGVCALRQGWCR